VQPKRREGKKMGKKKLLLALLTLTCLLLSISSRACFAEEESKETMYIAVFFATNPGELDLIKNVYLVFENLTVGPPVNTSLEAFNKGFVEVEYDLTPEVNRFFLSFNIFFEPSVENETANLYSNDIIQEFMKVFGHQGLELLWENQGIQESKVWFHRSFGYKPYTKEEVVAFLKYKPVDGFGKFIDGLISKYVPGDSITKLSSSYSLKRIGAGFYWTLKITATTSEVLPWDVQGRSESISINELLNNCKPLIEEPFENQRIIILIQKERTFQLSKGFTTYKIDIQKIRPEGYIITDSEFSNWPNTTEIKYEPLVPTENIIIDVLLDSSISKQELPPTVFEGVTAVIIAFLVLFFCVKKKLKKR